MRSDGGVRRLVVGHDTFCVESVCEDRFSWSGLSVLHARDYRSRMPSESVACLI